MNYQIKFNVAASTKRIGPPEKSCKKTTSFIIFVGTVRSNLPLVCVNLLVTTYSKEGHKTLLSVHKTHHLQNVGFENAKK